MAQDFKKEAEELLVCAKCGANMELRSEDGRDVAVCPYCGFTRVLPNDKDDSAEALREYLYERERARLRAEDEHSAMRDARLKRGRRIALAIVLTPFILAVIAGVLIAIFGDPTLERIDPFEGIKVTFSGIDGMGTVNIEGKPGVKYECRESGKLEENGKAIVQAESEAYNLKRRKCEYDVTGLDLYITDISLLRGEPAEFLRGQTVTDIEKEFGATGAILSSATKHYDSYEWAPEGFILLAKGTRADKIYDVIRLTFTRGEAQVTRYAVICYENAVRRTGGIAPVSYSRRFFCGGITDIGSMGSGPDPVWGSYMGVMTGFDTYEELESAIRTNNAEYTVFQKLDY
ncbi:MAG: hypothetical protein II590_03910 [Clostridia bacterium]|nr:hypothetical protein [Clostridia bacterium]